MLRTDRAVRKTAHEICHSGSTFPWCSTMTSTLTPASSLTAAKRYVDV